ncbi:hypothetical protein DN752_17870 [Echinicola strongylocentroti]|uniref:Phage tail protein n=2 Tax=Echinicola strongylocentroti TaxID=1795355 RepID=A0A2Z4IML2_9BACT|nr:hypothetical protein DN752_17870 [Echinicola strongylocentroti]
MDYQGAQNLEESAGLEVEVCIADYNDVESWPALPTLTGATESGEYVDLGAEVFTMKTGKKFFQFEATLEKNAFNSALVGARRAKSFENTLTIAKSGVSKQLFGWLRANRNRPLVVAFKFLGETDQYTFIGYKGIPAEVEEATSETPAEISGEKMTSITVRSIYYPPFYIDEVPLTEAV